MSFKINATVDENLSVIFFEIFYNVHLIVVLSSCMPSDAWFAGEARITKIARIFGSIFIL